MDIVQHNYVLRRLKFTFSFLYRPQAQGLLFPNRDTTSATRTRRVSPYPHSPHSTEIVSCHVRLVHVMSCYEIIRPAVESKPLDYLSFCGWER